MQKIRILLESYDSKLLFICIDDLTKFISNIDKSCFILSKSFLPKKVHRINLLRSPHVDKSSIDQFEIRTYRFFMYVVYDNVKFLRELAAYEPTLCVGLKFKKVKN